jgi:hypothetical protein
MNAGRNGAQEPRPLASPAEPLPRQHGMAESRPRALTRYAHEMLPAKTAIEELLADKGVLRW